MTDPAGLENLYDIVIPPPTPWWPPAPGWYALGALFLLGALILGWGLFARWWRNRYRRWALRELKGVCRALDDPGGRRAALRLVPEILKRCALAAFERESVASLTGEAWLEFLDRTSGTDVFSRGPGSSLAVIPYVPGAETDLGKDGIEELIEAVRLWVRRHAVVPDARG